nr:MAG TPA: hypothetical protein [Caudoviricetes sp.]
MLDNDSLHYFNSIIVTTIFFETLLSPIRFKHYCGEVLVLS